MDRPKRCMAQLIGLVGWYIGRVEDLTSTVGKQPGGGNGKEMEKVFQIAWSMTLRRLHRMSERNCIHKNNCISCDQPFIIMCRPTRT